MPFLAFCVQCVRSRTCNLRTPKPAVDKNETTLASPYNNSPKFDFTPFETLSLPIFLFLTLLFSFTFSFGRTNFVCSMRTCPFLTCIYANAITYYFSSLFAFVSYHSFLPTSTSCCYLLVQFFRNVRSFLFAVEKVRLSIKSILVVVVSR